MMATAKVKKTRINWSLPENQEKLQKWEAQEETEPEERFMGVGGEMVGRVAPLPWIQH